MMEIGLWMAVGLLLILVFCLAFRLILMKQSADEICEELEEKMHMDTNTLISVSSGDKSIRRLAETLNRELRELRKERWRLANGDLELKEAVTNLSHDLRTPLTAVCGYLDLLEKEKKSGAATEYLEIIRERTETLKGLTEELFRYSVITSTVNKLDYTPVDLKGILEESLASFYGALTSRGITPEISIPETPVLRCLDRIGLRRIFSNLLNNALKYSDGDLMVSLSSDGRIFFSNRAEGLTLVQVEKMFDRFYTVESGRNSTGLGLSIARLLTEEMGGEIRAGYEEGRLTIRLYFPG